MTHLALLILAASQSFNLPPGLLSALCFVESGHNVKAMHYHDGKHNSVGVCQVQPSTAYQLGYSGDEEALKDPKLNVYYAAYYLHYQLLRYNGDVISAVAAYNSGTFRVKTDGRPRNLEYIRKVLNAWAEHR